jgi:transcriptional regulator with XRE-family HTH domain
MKKIRKTFGGFKYYSYLCSRKPINQTAMQVKEVIKRHGFLIKDVAAMIGVSPDSLSQSSRKGCTKPATLHKIADAIGADYNEFFEDEQRDTEDRRFSEREGAVDGGLIRIGGRLYHQYFVPVDISSSSSSN